MEKTPMHVFKLELTCSRQTGPGIQQKSLDSLLVWTAALTSDEGIKLLNRLTALVQEILPGAASPISESGAKALEALGKGQQLTLGAICELPTGNGKQEP